MRRCLTAPALCLLLCAPAAAQSPAPGDQKGTLDAAREIAIHYASKLPDFICTENVTRNDSTSPTNIQVDRLVIQLSYYTQKEKYKLVTMNGQPAKQPLESLDGLITGGEFGSLQLGVFEPSSAADFQWKAASTLRKHKVAVYTYRIARANSHYMLGRRNGSGKMIEVPAGYHGEIYLDSETSRVLRLTAQADDMPSDSGILQSSIQVDYDATNVAGRGYLLPSRSESHMERMYRKISNVVTFTGYRKFEADSSIDFGH
jgi:hypothetical protein